jgi:hypothetical protein
VSVISLAKAREERTPHSEGVRVCLGCRHTWRGVAPIGLNTGLECPSCTLPKGVTKYLYDCADGDSILVCDCGCEAIFVYLRATDRLKFARCMACGTDLTESYFA